MTDQAEIECIVVVASPNAVVRRRWSKALTGRFYVYPVTGRVKMEQAITNLKPSVLLMDLDLRGAREDLRIIQRLSLSTKILALSSDPDFNDATLILEAGVKGYGHRDMDQFLLRKAVHLIQKGEVWVERAIIPYLVKKLRERKRAVKKSSVNGNRLTQLTARQREIAFLISNAATNKEIANTLKIAEPTVKSHVHVIFRKLGVSDRLGLALYVREKTKPPEKIDPAG